MKKIFFILLALIFYITAAQAGGISGPSSINNLLESNGLIANGYNVNPSANLVKWRLALGKARDGVSNARILFVGDSTITGIGSSLGTTLPNLHSWPTQFAKLMSFANGMGVPPSILSGNADGRWVAGTGWSVITFGAGGGADYTGTSPAGSLVYTSGVYNDGYYVYYLGHSSYGTITATATGGTPVVFSAATTDGTYKSAYIAAAAANAQNTLTVTCTGTCGIVGVEPAVSTMTQVLVGNAGVGSSSSVTWNTNSATFGGIPFIKAYAPDLCVISLGINDAGASLAAATYQTNMQNLITACKVSGDIIINDWPPSENSPYTIFEPQYLPILQSLALSNNAEYFSIYGRFGGVWMTNYFFDALHPNDYGYWDWAGAEKRFLDYGG